MTVVNRTTPSRQTTKLNWPALGYALIAIGFVAGCVLLASFVFAHPRFPPPSSPPVVEGLTIFAIFFVGAQALERLLEPLALVLDLGAAEKATAQKEAKVVQKLADNATVTDVTNALANAAQAKAVDEKKTAERTILFWGIATGLAALASGTFGFYFLSTVGIAVPAVWMEILGTALIIGSGTKPLHDLISIIEKKKQAAATAATG
jgi:hypothetical protein